MAKQGMKRYAPGNGMTKKKIYKENEQEVPELQGKAKESKGKAKPM